MEVPPESEDVSSLGLQLQVVVSGLYIYVWKLNSGPLQEQQML